MGDTLDLFVDAIIFQKSARGGVARVFREILPRMCSLDPGLRVTLLVDGPLLQPLPEHPQISVRNAPKIRRRLDSTGIWKTLLFPVRRIGGRLWNLLRSAYIGSGRSQIWHSTFYTFPAIWRGYRVVTVYDLILEKFPDLYSDPLDDVARAQKRRCINQADAVICISAATCQDVEKYYGTLPGSVHVIPLACSPAFRPLEKSSAGDPPLSGPFWLYLGSRAHYKNFRGLLEAYSRWPRREEISLLVVGEPWSPDEQALLKKLELQEKVRLVSGADDQRLCELYNQAVALVYPSLYEGFGIPLLEAMACNCPVVASLLPSSVEVAGDFPTYFDLTQHGALEAALDMELNRGRQPERLQAGYSRVRAFSWDKTARETLEAYRSLKTRPVMAARRSPSR